MEPERMDLRERGLQALIAAGVVLGMASLVWPALGLTVLVLGFALFAVAAALYAVFELGVFAYLGGRRATHHAPVAPSPEATRPGDVRVTMAREAPDRVEGRPKR